MSIIESSDLTKYFGDLTAVDHINLSINDKEIFGLVGPDGAGKTTTIRLLATILNISAGTATIDGYDVQKEPSSVRKLIGYMSQRFTLYADLTVKENLHFFARLHQVPKDQRETRTNELLDFSRLRGFEQRQAGRLSGGMQQKLALACTLIHQPKVLFLDEPTTGVDPVSRREFWRILTQLNQQGATLLVSTPYMDEAERCTRIAFMDNGRITACDTPLNIKNNIGGRLLELDVNNPRAALAILKTASELKSAYVFGELLQIAVDKKEFSIRLIRRLMADNHIVINSIKEIPMSMENAFLSLAGAKEDKGVSRGSANV
ncbi:MAG TPA: ABC transporter ATP-binding protein [Actinobacteria bacterium]|nr:ABC transporter ATP-binding protein [Actinomycetes bacterium]HEX21134.1 ABC transporter ATP-binding protein [Actinomycetota bacterium]